MVKATQYIGANTNPEQANIQCSIMDACDAQREDFEVLLGEVRDSFAHYLGKRPVLASTVVFLAGFYVGWKIKPW